MRLSIIILKNYGEASADNVLEISIILQTIIYALLLIQKNLYFKNKLKQSCLPPSMLSSTLIVHVLAMFLASSLPNSSS